MKILIVEDNPSLSRNLQTFLGLKSIDSEIAIDGKDALYKAMVNYYDVIVLDINIPEIDGLQVCKILREKEKDTPIIMLTSRSTKTDIVTGLESGADDYLVKPFDYDELIARVKTLARRNLKNKSNTLIEIEKYTINLEQKEVYSNLDKKIIKLSTLEYCLFIYLVQNKGRVISRKELYEKVWGEFEEFMFSKTVDVYIGYVRKKLGKDIITTKKGFGYIIN